MNVDWSDGKGGLLFSSLMAKRPTSRQVNVLGQLVVNSLVWLALVGWPSYSRVSGTKGKGMLHGALGAPLPQLRDNIQDVV